MAFAKGEKLVLETGSSPAVIVEVVADNQDGTLRVARRKGSVETASSLDCRRYEGDKPIGSPPGPGE